MRFNALKLKSKLLVGLIPLIVVVIIFWMFLSNSVTKSALDKNIAASVDILSRIAAEAVKTGLEFGDNESVASTIEVFKMQNDISLLSVQDTKGKEVYFYRKPGHETFNVHDAAAMDAIGNELFSSAIVGSENDAIGEVIIGMSLEKRDEALSMVRNWLSLSSLIALAILGAVIIFLATRLSNPIKELAAVAEELGRGRLDQHISVVGEDEMGALAQSFRNMIQSMENKANVANEIARGNLDIEIETTSADDVLGNAMQTMKSNLQMLIDGILEMYEQQKAGDYDAFIPENDFSGAYARLAKGINESLGIHIKNNERVLDVLGSYADGDFEYEMERLPGKQVVINERVDSIKNNLQNLVKEVLELTARAKSGDLSARGNADHFKGGYREIVTGINDTLNAIAEPLSASQLVLTRMAEGDLIREVEGDYKGDYGMMKNSLNTALSSLNDILGHVSVTVDKVANGAQQVSDSSQAVSQGATEQASSLEEITASITEVSGQSRQNADNASKANELSDKARDSADKGNEQMKQMLDAMVEINNASGHISKIIKVIDEIAFQTNLLALNAAVEAARAGVHGKGFAVVAEEVRSLAQRSAKAASETTELIEGSIAKVENGSQIANQSAEALAEIIGSITQVSDLMGEIAGASNEQVQGIEQISQGLQQIDQVTQTNTANAEESASAADELSDQARQLRNMLQRFKLRSTGVRSMPLHEEPEEREYLLQPAYVESPIEKTSVVENNGHEPGDIIALDDDDFGKF